MGIKGSSFLVVKQSGREDDHSPPSSTEVKIAWSYTSTPPIRLHGVVLTRKKHVDNFTVPMFMIFSRL
jgi:hypothetical protein